MWQILEILLSPCLPMFLFDKGGGGQSAPAPDPALVAAQVKSLGVQDDVMNQILANSKEMAPIQKEQLQVALDAAKLGQQQSLADRSYALERRGQLSGIQDSQIKDAQDFNTDAKREQLVQQAGEDAGLAFQQVRGQNDRALASRGIRANSGAALAVGQQTALSEAMAKAGLMNQTRLAARIEGRNLTDRAANSLAGYPSMGMSTTGTAASMGMAGPGVANNGLAGLNSGLSAAGTAAGQMGANATNMFNAQANYQVGMMKAQNEADSGAMGALGTLGSLGLKAYTMA